MKILLVYTLYFLSIATYSQNPKGIINYKAELSSEQKNEFIENAKNDEKMSMSIKQQIIDIAQNVKPDYYELHFKGKEAFFFYDESLEDPNSSYLNSKAGQNPFIIDLSSNKIIEDSRNFGFVAQELLDWKTTDKTKMIEGYKCYKATATETLYSRQGHFYDRDIAAWYAPDIPVEFGPKNYVGLPGLVLEVERKEFTITAIKINLNPNKDNLKIKRVGEDEKVISQKEMNDRIAEMMKDYEKR
ncbi:GLPGLI family protein [Psychroflexus lacisalsi]|jgi:GLPGLI family protein|uniref:GLPGLI family protein n=1 Tax=Psychroflexus lacisalsi TaxID=503928 RepID=A0ABN1K1G0_9FLAO|nr:GLPGLI family protein [Psychroflexus lacisalsi]MBZ9620728.1 GLPGLI family protein [Psychroflexus lacisalsi]